MIIKDEMPASRSSRATAQSQIRNAKKWISEEFQQALNRRVVNKDGESLTSIQQAVNLLVDDITNPDVDFYGRLAGLKFITEHLEGKASSMKDEETIDMPQFVICTAQTKTEEILKVAKDLQLENLPDYTDDSYESPVEVEISDEDGSNKQGFLG